MVLGHPGLTSGRPAKVGPNVPARAGFRSSWSPATGSSNGAPAHSVVALRGHSIACGQSNYLGNEQGEVRVLPSAPCLRVVTLVRRATPQSSEICELTSSFAPLPESRCSANLPAQPAAPVTHSLLILYVGNRSQRPINRHLLEIIHRRFSRLLVVPPQVEADKLSHPEATILRFSSSSLIPHNLTVS